MATYVEVDENNVILGLYINVDTAPTAGEGYTIKEVTSYNGLGFVEGQVFNPETGGIDDTELSLSVKAENELRLTDWKVIRHRDQVDLGATTSLTNDEYLELLQHRQNLRNTVLDA